MGSARLALIEEIEMCRNEMVRLASKTSLLNQEVITTSKKLDQLLNQFHCLNS
jgi:hypothetical protein